MDGLYAEAGCKRTGTIKTLILKALIILLVIMTFAFAAIINAKYLFALGMVLGALAVWYWPRFSVEWEYIFVDGQLDFDMISGGEKRKNILRIDFDEVDLVAPKNSHALDAYRDKKVYDYSSLKRDARVYVIIAKKPEQGMCQIYFEPSDKMLDMMKIKAPRKVMSV